MSEVEGFDKTPYWTINKPLASILCKHVSRSLEVLEHPSSIPSLVDLNIDRKQVNSIKLYSYHICYNEDFLSLLDRNS